jgi:hypothetical protein
VALGCALEAPETFVIFKRWWLLRFRNDEREEDKRSWIIPLAAVGLIVIVAGICVETYAEGKVSDIDAQLRGHESDKITAAESDVADATKKAAELDKETQGLKTDAANAKRDMVKAQLELARLTGPIHSVPVINGIATPDPMKGLRLRILLHNDVLIKFPTLPKGKSLNWTLFIVQDEKGNRQFGTIPKVMPGEDAKSPFGYFLYFPPHSFCTMELVTDEYGTTDLSFQGASCPSNATDTTSK